MPIELTNVSAAGQTPALVRGVAACHLLARLPAHALLGLIWVYQRTISPALPLVFGPGCGCRFSPTCSHYAALAVRDHGAIYGSWLALRRIVKCSPLHAGGFDPVPPRRARHFSCRRTPRVVTNRV